MLEMLSLFTFVSVPSPSHNSCYLFDIIFFLFINKSILAYQYPYLILINHTVEVKVLASQLINGRLASRFFNGSGGVRGSS